MRTARFVIIAFLILGLSWPVFPAQGTEISYEVKIVINGEQVVIPAEDQAAFIMGDRTYVPMRVVSENLGARVDWDELTRQVLITIGESEPAPIPERVGDSNQVRVVINGQVLEIPAEYGQAFITVKNRTVIPLRAVGEALGCEVFWHDSSRLVEINTRSSEPSRGDVERPEPEPQPEPEPEPGPAPQSPQQQLLLQELAGYRTNLKLMDGRVLNSAELVNYQPSDFSEQQLQQLEKYARELAKYPARVQLPDGSVLETASLEIRGSSIASAEQLKAWIDGETPRIRAKMEAQGREFIPISPELIDLYLRIGNQYGIRGDLAYCQAVKETEYFQFTGTVQADQNNYCGLWAVGSPCTGQEDLNGADPSLVWFEAGVHGAIFPTPEIGVEAHIQHLYAYASRDSLPSGKVLVDPRFNLVSRGCAPTWQGLNARWAVPGPTYGQSIIQDYWLKALSGR